jgi:cell division protein FtsI/penicillin-binding protein 2
MLLCGIALVHSVTAQAANVRHALHDALSGTTATAVVLNANDGRLLAAENPEKAASMASAPGSTLKPFFLAFALKRGMVRADETIVCRRNLRIAGRDLACAHPLDENVLDAERALAYSCNSYFANLATRFSPKDAATVLRDYGFGGRAGLLSGESPGNVALPADEADLQLMVLGLKDVMVTPAQLAHAYFLLSRQVNTVPAVERGLEGSVVYGMAHGAATPGLTILGKTGTASDPDEAWTHGWFAGIASNGKDSVVIVIYVPRGNGANAARLAHRFFELWRKPA